MVRNEDNSEPMIAVCPIKQVVCILMLGLQTVDTKIGQNKHKI